MIPYGKQTITEEDIQAVVGVLNSDFLTQGPKVLEFEKAFAGYVGSKYAVAVSNGTAALHLSALALNVNEKSRVITTPITFVASANCLRYCGGTVFFCDIDPSTFLIDLDKLERLLDSQPKGYFSGIIPVDFAGYPLDMERLRKLADLYQLWILEDACHAPGASFKDTKGRIQNSGNGQFADAAIFSFHPVKHIATGEGGMITTSNEKLYKELLKLRTHGITKDPSQLLEHHGGWYYEMQLLGYNYRLTDFQAALGLSQLKRADEGLKIRRALATRYDDAFDHTNVKIPFRSTSIAHAFHLYVIQVANRKAVYDHLLKNGIAAQVHYIPVHTMPYYSQFGWAKGSFPIAEKYYEQCLSLPMFPALTDEEQNFVIGKVLEATSQND